MKRVLPLLLIPACTWVGEAEWTEANDRDGDGALAAINGGDDCDDDDPSVHPQAEEICNGIDDDCDGEIDEGLEDANTWYTDADNDGWGDDDSAFVACEEPSGAVDRGGDCDDDDAGTSPGAEEICNGIDDDCDGEIDEGLEDANTWYTDADNDGWGDDDSAFVACEEPSGAVDRGGDCDDNDRHINPDEREWCDGVDEDCDGVIDNDAHDADTWYTDGDGDGWGDDDSGTEACEQPSGTADRDGDCDDNDQDINPDADEVCHNDIDDDCDGRVDERCDDDD